MRIEIISDGTTRNTQIIDSETGRKLTNVSRIEIIVDANQGEVNAVLHLMNVPLRLVVNNVKTNPPITDFMGFN